MRPTKKKTCPECGHGLLNRSVTMAVTRFPISRWVCKSCKTWACGVGHVVEKGRADWAAVEDRPNTWALVCTQGECGVKHEIFHKLYRRFNHSISGNYCRPSVPAETAARMRERVLEHPTDHRADGVVAFCDAWAPLTSGDQQSFRLRLTNARKKAAAGE